MRLVHVRLADGRVMNDESRPLLAWAATGVLTDTHAGLAAHVREAERCLWLGTLLHAPSCASSAPMLQAALLAGPAGARVLALEDGQ